MRKYLLISIAGLITLIGAVAEISRGFTVSAPERIPVSAGQVLRDIYQHNYNAGKLFMKGNIQLFDKGRAEGEPTETMTFKYYVSGNRYYQQTGEVEMLGNKDYSLYVHHDKQLIEVGRPDRFPEKQLFSQATFIDSLLHNDGISTEVQKMNDNLYMLKAKLLPDENISEYRIYYNGSDFSISKVEIDIRQFAEENNEQISSATGLVVINYDRLEKFIENEDEIFSGKRFIKKNRKTFELVNDFGSYQLINLIPDK